MTEEVRYLVQFWSHYCVYAFLPPGFQLYRNCSHKNSGRRFPFLFFSQNLEEFYTSLWFSVICQLHLLDSFETILLAHYSVRDEELSTLQVFRLGLSKPKLSAMVTHFRFYCCYICVPQIVYIVFKADYDFFPFLHTIHCYVSEAARQFKA